MDKKLFSLGCALLCSFIWGTGFIAQDMGMDHIGPLTFSAGRLFMGFITLLPFFFIFEFSKIKKQKYNKRIIVTYFIFISFLLSYGNSLQQFALLYTDVANAAIYTILYVVIVPFVAYYFFSKKTHWSVLPAVLICLVGGLLLTELDNVTVRLGDGISFFNAFFWAFHIVFISRFLKISIPFYFSIYNLTFINSYFEAVSGFTSTGFTIFENIKHIDQSLIIWRSSSQWIGGLYFLFSIILLIDIFDNSFKKSLTNFISFNKAETLKQSFKIFILYTVLTLMLFIILNFFNLRTFNSLNIAMTIISSGGFLPMNNLSNILINETQIIVFSFLMLTSFFSIFLSYNLIFFKNRNINFFNEDLNLFFYFITLLFYFLSIL